jgi:outer membrane protein assembly factor BamB
VNLEHGCSCAGTTDGAMFYAGTAGGWIYGVSLESALKLWTGYTGAGIEAPMEYFGGAVYVASTNGRILTAKSGRTVDILHNKYLGAALRAPFSVDARGCFVPCGDNSLYAFTADLTGMLWDQPFACKGTLQRGPQVGEKTIFQRAEGDKLYAIDLLNGQARWGLAEGIQVLAATGTDVYVQAAAGRLLQVDEILGTTKAAASLGGLGLFVSNAAEPVIYAGTSSGRIVCLKPITAGQMSPQMLKDAAK